MLNRRLFAAVLMSLLVFVITPLVAAASSLEAIPHAGAGGIFVTVAAVGLGLGAVYFVQRGKSVYSGGHKTEGDRVEMSEEDAKYLVEKGIIGRSAPRAEPAAPPPPAHERSEGERDILDALEGLVKRVLMLEKQVKALQEAEPEAPPAKPPAPSGPDATEGAVALAEAEGVDLSEVKPTREDGRIEKKDVEAFLEAQTS